MATQVNTTVNYSLINPEVLRGRRLREATRWDTVRGPRAPWFLPYMGQTLVPNLRLSDALLLYLNTFIIYRSTICRKRLIALKPVAVCVRVEILAASWKKKKKTTPLLWKNIF